MAATALVLPVEAGALHEPLVEASTISGTVHDPLGDPVGACVYAARTDTPLFGRESALDRVTTADAASGAFELIVVPGSYRVFVYDPPEGACPHWGVAWADTGRQFDRWGPVTVSSVTGGSLAVTLTYAIDAGAPGFGPFPPDVGRPGETVTVEVHMGNRLDGRATPRWETAGVALTPTRVGEVSSRRDRYTAPFTVPNVTEGPKSVSYWAQDAAGTRVTSLRGDTFYVDATPPFYVASVPADGGSFPPWTGQTVEVTVGDAAGAGVERVWMDLYDVSVTPDNPMNLGAMTQCSADRLRWCQNVGLLPNRLHRATFTITDWAGRVATHTIYFTTSSS